MRQTKTESFIESILNTASGFGVSLLFWTYVVVPVWNLPVTMSQNLVITAWFTALSVGRAFVWRRLFNAGTHRRVHAFLRRFYDKCR